LIGAVVGETDAIAVFVDRASNGIVRMRRGDVYAGWQLGSIAGREATLKNGDRTETVVMVREAPTAPMESAPPPPAVVSGTSFAPFIPRSTPKNGEHDGL
jgi:general secretion pathway protein N